MAIDPLKKLPKNRALQYKKESIEQGKGVRLYDVDLAIAEHMIDTVLPTVEIFQEKQKKTSLLLGLGFFYFPLSRIYKKIIKHI